MQNEASEAACRQKVTIHWVSTLAQGPKPLKIEGEVDAEIVSLFPTSGYPDRITGRLLVAPADVVRYAFRDDGFHLLGYGSRWYRLSVLDSSGGFEADLYAGESTTSASGL